MNPPREDRTSQDGDSIVSEHEESPREQRRHDPGSPGHRSNAGSNYGDYAPDRTASRKDAEQIESTDDVDDEPSPA